MNYLTWIEHLGHDLNFKKSIHELTEDLSIKLYCKDCNKCIDEAIKYIPPKEWAEKLVNKYNEIHNE